MRLIIHCDCLCLRRWMWYRWMHPLLLLCLDLYFTVVKCMHYEEMLSLMKSFLDPCVPYGISNAWFLETLKAHPVWLCVCGLNGSCFTCKQLLRFSRSPTVCVALVWNSQNTNEMNIVLHVNLIHECDSIFNKVFGYSEWKKASLGKLLNVYEPEHKF
jgi:hypothetical protein